MKKGKLGAHMGRPRNNCEIGGGLTHAARIRAPMTLRADEEGFGWVVSNGKGAVYRMR